MSEKTTDEKVHDITSMDGNSPADPHAAPASVPSRAYRAGRWLKKNKKTILAVGLGSLLVTGGAVAGRKTAPYQLEVVETEFDVPEVLVTPQSESEDTVA